MRLGFGPGCLTTVSLPFNNVFVSPLLVIVTAFQVSKVMFDHLDSVLVTQISGFQRQLPC